MRAAKRGMTGAYRWGSKAIPKAVLSAEQCRYPLSIILVMAFVAGAAGLAGVALADAEPDISLLRVPVTASAPIAPAPLSFSPFPLLPLSAYQEPAGNPDANSDSVGAVAGQYQIDPSGAATYSVPLYVPTGSANMQPALALNYSSRGANGPLGVGWSVSGLSVISRCKQGTEFGDGAGPFAQPNFDNNAANDAYCIDGARLLAQSGAGSCPVSGVAAGNVQSFGLELDTTTRVCGYKQTGINGYASWLVLPADGSIRRYGAAGSSALSRNANGVAQTDSYLSWSLDRQADRSGNVIDFSYQRDAANGELEISQINYTGKVDVSNLPTMGAYTRSPFASVIFNYETMPASGQRLDYLAGTKLALTNRLASIRVLGPNNYAGDTTATTLRTYHLSYTPSVSSGLSTLTQLTECAPNGGGEVCYPATTFTWNSTQAPGFTTETFGTALSNPFAAARDFKVANITGDGRQSVVFIEDHSCIDNSLPRFRIHTTVSFNGLQEVGSPIAYPLTTTRSNIPGTCGDTGPMHLETTYALYDLTGDGRDDLIVLTPTGWIVYPSASVGVGFDTARPISTGIAGTASDDGKLVDLFGDGLPALLHGVAGSPFSARHLIRSGNASPAYQFAASDVALDFDTPTDTGGASVVSIGINANNARVLAAGDIDGNGAADLIMRVQLTNAKRWYVYRNLGVQASGHFRFGVDEDLEPAGATVLSDDGNDVQFVDFGGNGQAGVMYQVPIDGGARQEIHYRLNIGKPDESAAGSRFGADNGAVITLPTARAKRVQVMDINEDHKADLVYYDKTGSNHWPLQANLFGTTGFGPTLGLCTALCQNSIDADITLSLFLDSNGDGHPMLYRFQGSNFGTGTNTLSSIAPDTLATITNGFGATTQITYQPLTIASVYSRGADSPQKNWGRGSPVFDVFGPFWVVGMSESSAPTNDASSSAGSATTTAQVVYHYAQARMQSGGRGFLGFGAVTSTDKQNNVQTQTTYRQDFPFVGRPAETQVTTVAPTPVDPCIAHPNLPRCHACNPFCPLLPPALQTDPLLTDSSDSWASVPTFNPATVQSLAIYRADSNEQHFDPATQAFSHMTDTAITIDAYGNALTTTVISSHADPASGNTLVDETLRTANLYGCLASPPSVSGCTSANPERARLGRLSVSTVTSTRPGGSTVRRVSFEYDPNTYQLISEIQGPYDDLETDPARRAALGLRTDYVLDAAGNRIETVQCSTADFSTRNACLNLGGFVQQQYASPTKIQRYSKTDWESLGRFALDTKVPFYSPNNPAGNEQIAQFTGVSSLGGGRFTTHRDPFGNPLNVVDANGILTTLAYGLMGRKRFASSLTGAFARTEYQWCQDAAAADIPAGAPRANCPLGAIYRLTEAAVQSSDGTTAIHPTVYTYYDALGRAVLKTTRRYQSSGSSGHWSSVASVYDSSGRITKTTVPYFSVDPSAAQGGQNTRAGMPESGMPASESAAFDAISRPTDQKHPEQAANGASDTLLSYNGTTITLTNPRNFASTSIQNGRAETIHISDAAGLGVDYNLSAFGTLTSVVRTPSNGDHAGQSIATYLAYDRLGRKSAISDPDKGYGSYGYNALGEQVTQIDAKGQKQTLYRDALGRLIKRTETRSDGSSEPISSWSYDIAVLPPPTRYGLGLIATESNGVGGFNKNTNYDVYGRIASIATTLDGTTYTESQTYDEFSRPLTHTDASATNSNAGETIGYASDGFAIQITEAASGALLDEINSMSPRGQTSMEQYGGSPALKTTRTFDATTGRLTNVISGSNGSLQNWTYTYDKHTNLVSRWNQATGYDQRESFSYDALDRLTDQTLTRLNGAALNSLLLHLDYDALGNITNKSGLGNYRYSTQESGCAQPGGVHAATVVGNQHYCYDANGNQIRATGATTRTISYTAYDLPEKIQQTSPTATAIDFAYAPDRSLYKRVDGAGPALPANDPSCKPANDRIFCSGFEPVSTGTGGGITTYYVGNVEFIVNGSAMTTKRYVGSFLVVTTTTNNPTPNYAYLFKDSIGSIDVITNASGTVLQRQSFDPHGMRRALAPVNPNWTLLTSAQLASFDTSFTRESFTGHAGLEAVGLIHMKGRLYDAILGRFIQADPLTEREATQGLNRYSYVLNNPLSRTDPTGYLSFDQAFGIAIGVVAGIASGGLGFTASGFLVAVGGGFVSAYVGSGFNGQAGLWGAFAAGVFWGIGSAFQQVSKTNGAVGGSGALSSGQFATKVALHGVTGGVLNSLRGGNFGNGFWAAGATEALSPQIDQLSDNAVAKVTAAAIVGGTVSAATGGKFANGAQTAAFQEVFNQIAHPAELSQQTEGHSPMATSEEGIQRILNTERFIPNLYNDDAGNATIGYGHLVHLGAMNGNEPEEFRLGINEQRGRELFTADLGAIERAVNSSVTINVTQRQFDSLVSFTFNVGPSAFASSTLLRNLNAGQTQSAGQQFGRWINGGGRVLPGLVIRRQQEADAFLNGN